jgi:predicted dehydrogenase
MTTLTRRTFLKTSALGLAGAALSARSWGQVAGANGDIRLALVGLNGKGRDHFKSFSALPGVRVVALCDVDTAVLDRAKAEAKTAGVEVRTQVDYRELLKSPDIDAVSIVTPNHQHALQAIWALQAGKDVFLEKPVSHNLWEGRQLVAAVDRYQRILQCGTQSRSSPAIAEALAWTQAGHLGKITAVRGLCYKRRATIGRTTGPQPVPPTVNYDLWLGPAPDAPLRRAKFHYDWHWQFATGNGDIGNQGAHQMDVARRFLGDPALPAHVFTVGGRFGYEDDGDTPNTLVVAYDYPVPLLFEVRGLPAKPDLQSGNNPAVPASGSAAAESAANSMDTYRGLTVGNIVHCEGGHLVVPAADYSRASAFDRDGKLVQEFQGKASHYANFIAAVRSRKQADLHAPVLQGHLSSSLCHLANITQLAGRDLHAGEIREQLKGRGEIAEAFGRMTEHLAANTVNLDAATARLGAPLTFDPAAEKFTGPGSAAANPLLTRAYRAPFVVPPIA